MLKRVLTIAFLPLATWYITCWPSCSLDTPPFSHFPPSARLCLGSRFGLEVTRLPWAFLFHHPSLELSRPTFPTVWVVLRLAPRPPIHSPSSWTSLFLVFDYPY